MNLLNSVYTLTEQIETMMCHKHVGSLSLWPQFPLSACILTEFENKYMSLFSLTEFSCNKFSPSLFEGVKNEETELKMGSVGSYFGQLCGQEQKGGKKSGLTSYEVSRFVFSKTQLSFYITCSFTFILDSLSDFFFQLEPLQHLHPSLLLIIFTEQERRLRANDRTFNLSFHYVVSKNTNPPVCLREFVKMRRIK